MGSEEGELPKHAPLEKKEEEYDWTKQNASLYVFVTCLVLLCGSIFRHAFFPPGRGGPLAPLPALVSTLPSDRGFSGPEGDYSATLEALKRARGARACGGAPKPLVLRAAALTARAAARTRPRARDPRRPPQHAARPRRRRPAPALLARSSRCVPVLTRFERRCLPARRTSPRRPTRSSCSWATPSRSRCAATARARSAWRSCRRCGRRRLRRTARSRSASPATAPRTCSGASPTAKPRAWRPSSPCWRSAPTTWASATARRRRHTACRPWCVLLQP